MRITLTTHTGTVHEMALPYQGAGHVDAEAAIVCGHCGAPLRAIGQGQTDESRDTVRADAVCASEACGKLVGVLRVKPATLFGLEEDRRVAGGLCRVY